MRKDLEAGLEDVIWTWWAKEGKEITLLDDEKWSFMVSRRGSGALTTTFSREIPSLSGTLKSPVYPEQEDDGHGMPGDQLYDEYND